MRWLSRYKFAFRCLDSVLEIGEASNNVARGGEEKIEEVTFHQSSECWVNVY